MTEGIATHSRWCSTEARRCVGTSTRASPTGAAASTSPPALQVCRLLAIVSTQYNLPPGSRNGALIATAWAAMVLQGREGYMRAADSIMKVCRWSFSQCLTSSQAAGAFADAVRSIPQLELTGTPDSCVVGLKAAATRAGSINVYALNDMLKARGWHLSALQHPPALHMCFTAAHAHVADTLVKVRRHTRTRSSVLSGTTLSTQDLTECCAALAADPASAPEGSAPFYGMAASMPDRRLVGDFLEAYQDALLTV